MANTMEYEEVLQKLLDHSEVVEMTSYWMGLPY